jgi:F0F1-type ATP synthase assembly protein I
MALGFGKSDAGMMRTAWELSAAMLSLVVAIGIGWWFGGLLDAWIGTAPWLMLLFLCFGLVAGVLNVYRAVSRAIPPSSVRSAPEHRGPGDQPWTTGGDASAGPRGRTPRDG